MNIIDRRLNPKGKSLPNRQRLLRRLKAEVQEAVAQSIAGRRITEVDSRKPVPVPVHGIAEPSFRKGNDGRRDFVLPGNRKFVKGDIIPKPPGGEGGSAGEAADSGDGEDDFTFSLSREEFLDIFFDDMELPDMVKRRLKETNAAQPARAGYSIAGSPQALDVLRTMRNGLARRLALRRPRQSDMDDLLRRLDEAEASGEGATVSRLTEEMETLRRRLRLIPWIDPVDIRYRRFEYRPVPIAQAVMFCLMDVSGSMNEHMKDLAKRFFMLLYLFLTRRYRAVDIVFIRHTHEAQEVDEDTFFHSRETGGTVVSTALDEMNGIIARRYPPDSWNIYVAQASDGDNMASDRGRVETAMTENALPACQYFAYLEVDDPPRDSWDGRHFKSELWRTYEKLLLPGVPLALRRATSPGQIFGVLHDLFARERAD
ncbi:MAG TPA: YeaH/YhbH family protein [Rhodospirillaceae bacterium]|nr:YeaH/YhbH family protein [Rhodospirillaceae bacterium]